MGMDEKYRLIFRGEILEGQHRAVVKRRLAEALKLDEARLEALFSGRSVVLKRNVDRKTAARYQAVFKEAGGRLRVKAEQPQADGAAAAADAKPGPAPPPTAPPDKPGAAGLRGTAAWNADIQAPDFKVQTSYFATPEAPRAEIEAPEFPLAEVGARISEPTPGDQAPAMADVSFDLAEVGADLITEHVEVVTADIGPLDFDLAEAGADLGPVSRREPAAAPDVSHLVLIEP